MTPQEADALLSHVARQLGEHFDAVQILATWNEQATTRFAHIGVGNFYARTGMAHEFLDIDQSRNRAAEIQSILPTAPPDDSEEWKNS